MEKDIDSRKARNIWLTIEYAGTNYLGWQRQPQGLSVQEAIEDALSKITRERVVLTGSGRTDSGVHAIAQAANFKTSSRIGTTELQRGLNSTLPRDISIKSAEEMPENFHAQYDARSKTYLYRVLNSPHRSALERGRAWHVAQRLDLDSMRKAAKFLVGEHDFKAFALTSRSVKTTVRRVHRLDICDMGRGITGGRVIEFEVEAGGFIKRMVRLIVGTLVKVGKGRLAPEDVKEALRTGNRTPLMRSAPAQGLFLKEVRYGGGNRGGNDRRG